MIVFKKAKRVKIFFFKYDKIIMKYIKRKTTTVKNTVS